MCASLSVSSQSEVCTWGRYGDLKPGEIDLILAKSPIVYVPWGALEWHSAHAPIGLDSTKAEGVCVALAKNTGGVVLPAIPLATNTIKPYKGFPHSIDISAGLISNLSEEICVELAEEGFRLVVLLTGHYPPEQLDALELGAQRAGEKCESTTIKVCADNHFLEGGDFSADHAGAYETSYQMYFQPGSVDLSGLPDRELTLEDDGITGVDPRKASEAQGAKQLEVLLKNALPQIAAWSARKKV